MLAGAMLAGFALPRPTLAQALATADLAAPEPTAPAAPSAVWAATARARPQPFRALAARDASPVAELLGASRALVDRLPVALDVDNLLDPPVHGHHRVGRNKRTERRMLDHVKPGLNEACRVYRVSFGFHF